jgi:hypothetical protein
LAEIDNTIGLWSLGDFKPDMPTVRGATGLVHRLVLRWQTARGRFSWVDASGTIRGWPNFGTNLAQYLLTKTPPRQIAIAAELEARKDEQVSDIRVAADVQDGGKRILLSVRVVAKDIGPFVFTLSIEKARTTLIDLQAAA